MAVIAIEGMGPAAKKWHAPKSYMDTATAGITVDIAGPTKDVKIELTWGDGKPFIERNA